MNARLALVTGGTGFVASHLIPALLGAGWKARATGRRPRPPWLPGEADYRVADLATGEGIGEALAGVTHLFHLAGASSSLASEAEMHSSNVVGTENLLAAGHASGLERVLYMSSTSVYGEEVELRQPVPENVEPHPSRGYGKAKWLAEQAVWRYAEKGLEVVVVRPVSIYGPGAVKLLASAVLDIAIERIAGLKKVEVWEKPIEQRLVHVADLVRACLHLMGREDAVGRAFNLASENYPTSHELAGMIAGELGLELEESDDPECGPTFERRAEVREQMLAAGMVGDIVFTRERLRFMRKANRNNRLSLDALASTGFKLSEAELPGSIAGTVRWYLNHRWIL